MTWNTSCPDWEQRLRTGRTLVPDLPLDLVAGNRAVAVFDRLRLADVPGTPTMGEAGGDWFRDIVRALFGSVDPVTKARMIRELFLLVPKKNSKTTNGALLMLTALLLNERPRAPFLLTAPVQKTADEAFSAIAGAIALDPVLDKKLQVRDHLKLISHRESKARLEIATFDPAMMTGKKVVGALVDEEHVLGKMSRADKAMLQLRGGMQPFPEAFLAIITTQSDDEPVGIFKEDLKKARDVRDGLRQSSLLPVLYEFPRDMQQDEAKPWRDPANWAMVTPNVGRSISLDRLEADCKDAEEKGAAALRLWASQHLNIEIGLALRSDGWAGAEFWLQAPVSKVSIEELIARCDVITVGIDGGGLDDMLGFWALGRARVGGDWLSWAHAWIHPIALERRKSEASRYHDFAAAGDLTIVENIGDDVEQVADVVEQIFVGGRLPEKGIGVDPVGIGAIVDALEARGIDPDKYIVGVPQGWKLSGAIKTTERRLAEGKLHHSHAPLLTWCVGNCRVEPRGNAITITKQAAGFAKIDPVMALFNAVTLMTLVPEPDVIYADYELMTV